MSLYTDVADWLSPDIVEAIEVSVPCPGVPTGQHLWDYSPGTADYPPAWECVYCRVDTFTDPRPMAVRHGPIHRLEEFS